MNSTASNVVLALTVAEQVVEAAERGQPDPAEAESMLDTIALLTTEVRRLSCVGGEQVFGQLPAEGAFCRPGDTAHGDSGGGAGRESQENEEALLSEEGVSAMEAAVVASSEVVRPTGNR